VDALSLTAAERAEALVRSACSSNLRQARTLLDADPALGRYDLAAACVTGEAAYVAQRLAHAPHLARTPIPPLHHEPLLYASFSRLLRGDPQRAPGIREVVHLLLEAGADPNASFDEGDWLQVPLYGSAGIATTSPSRRCCSMPVPIPTTATSATPSGRRCTTPASSLTRRARRC
jgi:hypothetical protein